MTIAIIENRKIVGFKEVREEQIKHTPEEYKKRLDGIVKKRAEK